jgi:transposase
LLGTARLNGIDPQRYLLHVLGRIADHPSNRIDELLPWAVAAKWERDAAAKDLPLAA